MEKENHETTIHIDVWIQKVNFPRVHHLSQRNTGHCNFQSQRRRKRWLQIASSRENSRSTPTWPTWKSENDIKWPRLFRAVLEAQEKMDEAKKKRKCVCKCSIVNQVIFPIIFNWFWNYGKFPILSATHSGGWHIHQMTSLLVWTDSSITSWQGMKPSTEFYEWILYDSMTWCLLQGPGQPLILVHL